MAERDHMTLLHLQEEVRDTLKESFREPVWVRAEISEIKNNRSGHCYLTLVEKDPASDTLLARAQAVIWASTYRTLRPFFESAAGCALAAGMDVLVRVMVQYSELYGLSLIIYDIDPSFTVGELEMARQRTIERLKADGMFDMNATLPLPPLPRRFAVITSDTAAGYRDFMRHLHENECGYSFVTELFPAVMQGADSPRSVIAALDAVAARCGDFDAVLVLRGGGGAMDLVCFDDYELAVNVAQFPIPVFAGIGHDHDYHVIDMVAHTSVKTPTALADFIIDILALEEGRVDGYSRRLSLALKGKFGRELANLDRRVADIRRITAIRWMKELRRVEALENRVSAADPASVLSRGYSMTLRDGHRIDRAGKLHDGDVVSLVFEDGSVSAVVKTDLKN